MTTATATAITVSSRFLLQYNIINILLLQSQTDRCESDIHNDMYDSITDNCHAGQYCGKYCDYSDLPVVYTGNGTIQYVQFIPLRQY